MWPLITRTPCQILIRWVSNTLKRVVVQNSVRCSHLPKWQTFVLEWHAKRDAGSAPQLCWKSVIKKDNPSIIEVTSFWWKIIVDLILLKPITRKMAGTRAICANQPIRSPLSEAEIGEGRIYFWKPSGQSYDCKISEVFTGEERERLKESRLIIV